MICVRSYQDIKGPDELEEEDTYESILNSLLSEYDGEGSYSAYRSWCRERASKIMEKMEQEENEEE